MKLKQRFSLQLNNKKTNSNNRNKNNNNKNNKNNENISFHKIEKLIVLFHFQLV